MNNIYLVTSKRRFQYDTYDSFVVIARSEQDAKNTHPSGKEEYWQKKYVGWLDWIPKEDVDTLLKVELIGTTDKEVGVVLSSYNAG